MLLRGVQQSLSHQMDSITLSQSIKPYIGLGNDRYEEGEGNIEY